jgi:hypothetical protein
MASLADKGLQLTEQIAGIARELGIDTALIGAAALAMHHYVRASEDIDLAAYTDLSKLRELQQRLEAMQLHTELRTPDEQDDLGGVLEVWQDTDEDGDPIDSIEIVNFANPWRPGRRTPARDAVANAQPIDASSPLRCVQLADLIALKLDAGGPRDKADVIDVLARNPDADLDAIRAVCARYGFEQTLEELIVASRSE